MDKLHLLMLVFLIPVLDCCNQTTDQESENTQHEIINARSEDSFPLDSTENQSFIYMDSIYSYAETVNSVIKYGYKNHLGVIITEPVFDLAGVFYKGFAPVVQGDVHGIIDTTGELIYIFQQYRHALWFNELSGVYEFTGISEGMYKIQINDSSYGYINQKHQLVTEKYYSELGEFSEGRASYYNSQTGKYGFINRQGHEIINSQFEMAWMFCENRAPVKVDGKIGFIDTMGVIKIPAKYSATGLFSEGLCHVSISEHADSYYYIDINGNIAIQGPFELADQFRADTAVVYKRGACRVINKTGKELRKLNYDYFSGC